MNKSKIAHHFKCVRTLYPAKRKKQASSVDNDALTQNAMNVVRERMLNL